MANYGVVFKKNSCVMKVSAYEHVYVKVHLFRDTKDVVENCCFRFSFVTSITDRDNEVKFDGPFRIFSMFKVLRVAPTSVAI